MTAQALPCPNEEKARGLGFTSAGLFDNGHVTLTVAFRPDTDLDGEFEALCLDTGEMLKVNGWLFGEADQWKL